MNREFFIIVFTRTRSFSLSCSHEPEVFHYRVHMNQKFFIIVFIWTPPLAYILENSSSLHAVRLPSSSLSPFPCNVQYRRPILVSHVQLQWSPSRYVPEVSNTSNDQPHTQLYFIRTTLHVSYRWIHHQVYTGLKFIGKCNLYCDVPVSVLVGSNSTQ